MRDINDKIVCDILNEVMEYELAGVVRYTHSSLMVSGPNRIPIVEFLQAQAQESLTHVSAIESFVFFNASLDHVVSLSTHIPDDKNPAECAIFGISQGSASGTHPAAIAQREWFLLVI